MSLHELFDLIGKYLGRRIYHINCPMWLAIFGARFVKMISLGKVDYIERVLRMGENREYGHTFATRDFQFEPEAFESGLQREVNEYLKNVKNK